MQVENFLDNGYVTTSGFTQHNLVPANASVLDTSSDDNMVHNIDLNEQLIRNRPATFFMRVSGTSMINAGIFDGDILIVDRSCKPLNGKIVIAVIDGEMLIRRLELTMNKMRLVPETLKLATIDVSEFSDFKIWGVVTCVIRMV